MKFTVEKCLTCLILEGKLFPVKIEIKTFKLSVLKELKFKILNNSSN